MASTTGLVDSALAVAYKAMRGAFIERSIALEHLTGEVCAGYLGRAGRRDILGAAVLTHLPHSKKLEALAAILNDSGLKTEFPTLLDDLREVSRYRNIAAHATGPLTLDEVRNLGYADEIAGPALRSALYFRRLHRGRWRVEGVDSDTIIRLGETSLAAQAELLRLVEAVEG